MNAATGPTSTRRVLQDLNTNRSPRPKQPLSTSGTINASSDVVKPGVLVGHGRAPPRHLVVSAPSPMMATPAAQTAVKRKSDVLSLPLNRSQVLSQQQVYIPTTLLNSDVGRQESKRARQAADSAPGVSNRSVAVDNAMDLDSSRGMTGMTSVDDRTLGYPSPNHAATGLAAQGRVVDTSPASTVFSASGMDDSQDTVLTVPDRAAAGATNDMNMAANAPQGVAERSDMRQRANHLRLRLSLASYKVRTSQTEVPISRLQIRCTSPGLPRLPSRATPRVAQAPARTPTRRHSRSRPRQRGRDRRSRDRSTSSERAQDAMQSSSSPIIEIPPRRADISREPYHHTGPASPNARTLRILPSNIVDGHAHMLPYTTGPHGGLPHLSTRVEAKTPIRASQRASIRNPPRLDCGVVVLGGGSHRLGGETSDRSALSATLEQQSPAWCDLTSSVVKGRAADGLLSLRGGCE